MKPVIITLVDRQNHVQYDLELPVDVRINDLLDDVIQTLNSSDGYYRRQPEYMEFFAPRMNRVLDRRRTLWEEAVWNGDYLYLRNSARDD